MKNRDKEDCEFMLDGKLRGGKIIAESRTEFEVACHSPHYRKIKLPKDKVKVLPAKSRVQFIKITTASS